MISNFIFSIFFISILKG